MKDDYVSQAPKPNIIFQAEPQPMIPRQPFQFDAEGFDNAHTYQLRRRTETHVFTYYKCVPVFNEGKVTFDVSSVLVTWERRTDAKS